jgi:tol-pal system protein YbgF
VLLVVSLAAGCVVDKTGKSASYILQDRVESNRLRVHTIEKDLALQVTRVDDMEERAMNARQRLADSGATLESFLEELQALRGEVSDLSHRLSENRGTMGAVEFRLGAMEARLSHMEKELDITPPLILPPMTPPPAERAAPSTDGRAPAPAGASAGDPPEDDEEDSAVAALGKPEDDEVVVSSSEPSEEDILFQQALVLIKKKDYEKAGSRLQRFIQGYPDSPRVLEAQFLTGQCLFELGRFKAAITTFQKAIEMDETSPFAPRSMFLQALSFEELGTPDDLEAAKVFFGELVRLYPDSDDANRAKRKLEALGAP